MSGHNEPQTIAAAPARAATARLISCGLAAPVAATEAIEGLAEVIVEAGVSVGLLNVVSAVAVWAVAFQPVACELILLVVVLACFKYLVTVWVVDMVDVTVVVVVVSDQSPVGASARVAGVRASRTAATAIVKRILV